MLPRTFAGRDINCVPLHTAYHHHHRHLGVRLGKRSQMTQMQYTTCSKPNHPRDTAAQSPAACSVPATAPVFRGDAPTNLVFVSWLHNKPRSSSMTTTTCLATGQRLLASALFSVRFLPTTGLGRNHHGHDDRGHARKRRPHHGRHVPLLGGQLPGVGGQEGPPVRRTNCKHDPFF